MRRDRLMHLLFDYAALALLIALPLAFISDRFVFPGKGLLGSIILVPMILPPFVIILKSFRLLSFLILFRQP